MVVQRRKRSKMTPGMKHFKLLERAAKGVGERKDCAVKAVAIAGRVTYRDAHTRLKAHGRKNREATPNRFMRRALRQLGVRLKKVKVKAKTIRTVERELDPDKTYIIWVRGHVLVFNEGEICDWSKGRLHRIKEVSECIYEL